VSSDFQGFRLTVKQYQRLGHKIAQISRAKSAPTASEELNENVKTLRVMVSCIIREPRLCLRVSQSDHALSLRRWRPSGISNVSTAPTRCGEFTEQFGLIVFGEKRRDDLSHRIRKFFMQRELARRQTHAPHAGNGGETLHF
jgi:hypothetical protein